MGKSRKPGRRLVQPCASLYIFYVFSVHSRCLTSPPQFPSHLITTHCCTCRRQRGLRRVLIGRHLFSDGVLPGVPHAGRFNPQDLVSRHLEPPHCRLRPHGEPASGRARRAHGVRAAEAVRGKNREIGRDEPPDRGDRFVEPHKCLGLQRSWLYSGRICSCRCVRSLN